MAWPTAAIADQKQDALAVLRFVSQQLDGIGDRVEDRGAIVARLQVAQIGVDESFAVGKVPSQLSLTVEFHQRDSCSAQFEKRAQHCAESLQSRKFVRGTAPALDSDNQGDRLAFGRFVHAYWLFDSIVFYDEVAGL